MKQNLKNSNGQNSRWRKPAQAGHWRTFPAGRFAAEKKKTIVALCLIAIMVFMWVRLLGRKGPQSVNASEAAEATRGQTNPESKISFIKLPKVHGRNDVLTRDFFTISSWLDFVADDRKNISNLEEVSIVSKSGSEKTVRLIAEKLKLEAIAMGENPLAVINDMPLSEGEKLIVKNGNDIYECEVAEIEEDKVLIRYAEAEITLMLTQTPILDY